MWYPFWDYSKIGSTQFETPAKSVALNLKLQQILWQVGTSSLSTIKTSSIILRAQELGVPKAKCPFQFSIDIHSVSNSFPQFLWRLKLTSQKWKRAGAACPLLAKKAENELPNRTLQPPLATCLQIWSLVGPCQVRTYLANSDHADHIPWQQGLCSQSKISHYSKMGGNLQVGRGIATFFVMKFCHLMTKKEGCKWTSTYIGTFTLLVKAS